MYYTTYVCFEPSVFIGVFIFYILRTVCMFCIQFTFCTDKVRFMLFFNTQAKQYSITNVCTVAPCGFYYTVNTVKTPTVNGGRDKANGY
jgi:hypothetical protein